MMHAEQHSSLIDCYGEMQGVGKGKWVHRDSDKLKWWVLYTQMDAQSAASFQVNLRNIDISVGKCKQLPTFNSQEQTAKLNRMRSAKCIVSGFIFGFLSPFVKC